MYKTILVAYDGSEFSKAGLLEAGYWIKKYGGDLYIIYVAYFNEEEFLISPEIREKRINYGIKLCEEVKEEINKKLGIKVQCVIKEGDPTEEIIKEAEHIRASLIVVGTQGKRKSVLKNLVVGSVSIEIALKSPVDVLIVKKFRREYKGEYRKILVPFDNLEFSKKALKKAFEFYKNCGSRITVCYVIPKYQEMIEFYITPSIKERIFKEAKKILEEAEKLAQENGVPLETVIEEGNPGEKIVEISEVKRSNLIIIGPYSWEKSLERAFIGSTTERILLLSQIPVLVVKENLT